MSASRSSGPCSAGPRGPRRRRVAAAEAAQAPSGLRSALSVAIESENPQKAPLVCLEGDSTVQIMLTTEGARALEAALGKLFAALGDPGKDEDPGEES